VVFFPLVYGVDSWFLDCDPARDDLYSTRRSWEFMRLHMEGVDFIAQSS
jgi:hypothetical protein